MEPITNIHNHVFSGKCAPDYFFKMVLPDKYDKYADDLKALLEGEWAQKAIGWLLKLTAGNDRSMVNRYLQFIKIGTEASQAAIFERMKKAYDHYDPNARFVALTLNMDYMDTQKSHHARFDTQVWEVMQVREKYPNQFFPFLCIDPRHKQGTALRDWAKSLVDRKYFFGLKMYPSLGYFPFDPALDETFKWASENGIPVMTHCTRFGTYYTGAMKNVLYADNPPTLNPGSAAMAAINARVKAYRADAKVYAKNNVCCNVFLHPENYIPVLEKYPELVLCLAHFGGDDQMMGTRLKDADMSRIAGNENWHQIILGIMKDPRFSNVYTDISYSLNNVDIYGKLQEYLQQPELQNKILFGTDYFMTEKEKDESVLLKDCLERLYNNGMFDLIARRNTQAYLKKVI